MIYSASELITAVRKAIDQNVTSETLEEFSDQETLSLNDIIYSKIEESVRRVHMEAPYHLLDTGTNISVDGNVVDESASIDFHDPTPSVNWPEDTSDFSGYILLPNDFMRLVSFKMSDWERTVFNAIDINSPKYERQFSKYKGIRGNIHHPVCVLSMVPEGRTLEFYSCSSQNATIETAVYLQLPKLNNNNIKICTRCYNAVIYTIAALTLITIGENEKSNLLGGLAKNYLQ